MTIQSTSHPAVETTPPVETAVPEESPAEAGRAPSSATEPAQAGLRRHDIRYNRLFALTDMLAIALASAVTALILTLMGREQDPMLLASTFALMLPIWFVIAYIAGLYNLVDLKISHSMADEIGRVTIAATAWSWLLLVIRTPLTDGPIAMAGPTLRWLIVIPLMLLARTAIRGWVQRHGWHVQPVMLVGTPEQTERLVERIERHPDWGLEVKANLPFEGHLGRSEDPVEVAAAVGVDRVLIAGGKADLSERVNLVSRLVEHGLKVDMVSGGPETLYSNAVLHELEGLPVMSVRPSNIRAVDLWIKRLFDILASGTLLVLTAPLLAWAALRIRLDSPGPILFRQVRAGYRGREFRMLKLRTMVDGADNMRQELRDAAAENGDSGIMFKMEDDPRITPAGRFLRKWSIDELPQLWNVLVGDMSMVGPRPLPLDEAVQASGIFAARTRLRPGIAGAWQARGRSAIPFEDMIRLDYAYVAGWSMAEDLRLLIRTTMAVLSRTGAH